MSEIVNATGLTDGFGYSLRQIRMNEPRRSNSPFSGRVEDLLRERETWLRERSAAISGAATAVRVGRNEACPCGSGFKYKRCQGQPI